MVKGGVVVAQHFERYGLLRAQIAPTVASCHQEKAAISPLDFVQEGGGHSWVTRQHLMHAPPPSTQVCSTTPEACPPPSERVLVSHVDGKTLYIHI